MCESVCETCADAALCHVFEVAADVGEPITYCHWYQSEETGDRMEERITKDLREWVSRNVGHELAKHDLLVIADSIDATSGSRLANTYAKAYRQGTRDVLTMPDARLEEHGLVRLPKDKDGDVIRLGDVLECGDVDEKLVARCIALIDGGEGWVISETWPDSYAANAMRHVRLTPSDRLREMASEIDADAGTNRKMARVQRDLLKMADELEEER